MNTGQLLTHFDRIADSPDAVSKLRKFVLTLAVQGKLVTQNANDEPAPMLLRKVVQITGRSPSMESLPEPFSLPLGWAWSTVGDIATKTGSGSTPRGGRDAYKRAGIPFLRSQNIYDDGLRLDDVALIDATTHERMSGTAVRSGDLLLNITGGSIGRCCRVTAEPITANISQHVAIIRLAVTEMGSYAHLVVRSPFFQRHVLDEQTGAGRGGLPKNRMDRIPIPIPPLAEQHRIVAKVDELMSLCDQLEACLASADDTRRRLLDALLAEALQPALQAAA